MLARQWDEHVWAQLGNTGWSHTPGNWHLDAHWSRVVKEGTRAKEGAWESQRGQMGRAGQASQAIERVLMESGRSPDWDSRKPAGERPREDRQTPVDGRLEPTGPRERRGAEPAGGDSATWERGGAEAKSPGTPARFQAVRGRRQKGRGRRRAAAIDSEDGKHGSKQNNSSGEKPPEKRRGKRKVRRKRNQP